MEGSSSYGSDLTSLDATELRLGLPGSDEPEKVVSMASRVNKRALLEAGRSKRSSPDDESIESRAKSQVVGWPPIRSYRRNSFTAKKMLEETMGIFVKVSMDGAPYLRKIDLKVYKGYTELREALEDMFKNFSLGEISAMEGYNGSDYAITYEDKDGDWMLVGDVPWEMFISSCKRLRIMRGTGAKGFSSSS